MTKAKDLGQFASAINSVDSNSINFDREIQENGVAVATLNDLPRYGTDYVDSAYVSSQLPRYGTDYVDSNYVSSQLPRYGTDYVDSAYVSTQINNLIDGAPTALDTLNELAAALQNDSDALAALVTVVDTKLNTADTISLVDSAYVNARVSTVDSAQVQAIISAEYIQSNQTTYNTSDFVDSSYVSTQINSLYIPSYGTDYVDSSYVSTQINNLYIPSYGNDYVDSAYVASQAFNTDSDLSITGYITASDYIRPGSSAETAVSAGAGALKYDSVSGKYFWSDGSSWKILVLSKDGLSQANAISDLSDVAYAYTSDTTLHTTVQGYGDGSLTYTVDFSTVASPKYQATWTGSGNVFSTAGASGGCSQGTGAGWTVWDAAIYCMRGGARLCSEAELKAGTVSGTGCSHDSRAVWTYTTNASGQFFRGRGTGATPHEYVDGTNTSPSGYSINEIGIRCCGTAASGGALWEI